MAGYDVDDDGQYVFFKCTRDQWHRYTGYQFVKGMLVGMALSTAAYVITMIAFWNG